ncbi:MAG: hypothetical protein H6627_01500 [Calditrichae bacterium]|nr:hypothetical protein [Calditrichota bacterium]MCB9057212.1 hypothetical protein [Calditrichia bacterium]
MLMLRSFVILLIAVAFAWSQGSPLNFSGNGARAAAMGNAFTGVADDATAISWNPAGLTQLYSPEASIIGRFNFNSADISGYQDLGIGIESWDIESESNFKINFASIVFPFTVGKFNIVGGVAYRNQYDLASEVTQTISDGFNEYEIYDVVDGGVNAISPSLGIQFNEMFSAGVAVNILTGTEEGEGYDDYFGGEYDYAYDYSGVSFDIGLLFRPSSMIAIGANLNLPHDITEEMDGAKFKLDVPFFYSIGTGIRATDNLLLAFDYQSRAWSNSKIFKDLGVDLDLNSIHFGLEYLIQNGNAIFPIRAGFYTNPLLQMDDNGDQIVTNVITVGTGIVMGTFIVDAAFEIESAEYDYGQGLVYDETNMRLTLGGTIHFGK